MSVRAVSSGDKLGPRKRAASPSTVGRFEGSGYGVTNPMSSVALSRASSTLRVVQLDMFDGEGQGGDWASMTQAKRGCEAGRSPA